MATSLGVLSWAFLIQPALLAEGLTTGERLVSAAYPVMDLLVVAVAGSALDERESALVALVVVTLVYAPLRARGWEWARRWLRGDR